MSQFAQVHSLEALIDFRARLCTFGVEAQKVLLSVQMSIQRALDWVEDQAHFWHKEVRRWEETVVQARAELDRRRIIKIGDRTPDCTEQERILRRAQQRLEEAEEKLATSRRWLPELRREVDEYLGPARLLSGFLEGEQARALALMQSRIDALQAYIDLAAPVSTPPAAAAEKQ
jgi:hypothetical protein